MKPWNPWKTEQEQTATPQPVPQEPREPEDAQDKQEGPELEGVQDTQEAQRASGTQRQEAGGEGAQDRTGTGESHTTRKPHTAFIAHEKAAGTRPGDAWKRLKRLASESRGSTQVQLSDYGPIYLKRDKRNSESAVRYKHDKFEKPEDGELVNKGAFDRAWWRQN